MSKYMYLEINDNAAKEWKYPTLLTADVITVWPQTFSYNFECAKTKT